MWRSLWICTRIGESRETRRNCLLISTEIVYTKIDNNFVWRRLLYFLLSFRCVFSQTISLDHLHFIFIYREKRHDKGKLFINFDDSDKSITGGKVCKRDKLFLLWKRKFFETNFSWKYKFSKGFLIVVSWYSCNLKISWVWKRKMSGNSLKRNFQICRKFKFSKRVLKVDICFSSLVSIVLFNYCFKIWKQTFNCNFN